MTCKTIIIHVFTLSFFLGWNSRCVLPAQEKMSKRRTTSCSRLPAATGTSIVPTRGTCSGSWTRTPPLSTTGSTRKTLSHILFPSVEYNFWDVYAGLLRDPTLSRFKIELSDRPRLILIYDDVMDVSITYHGMIGTYVWELWGVLVSSHKQMSEVVKHIWITKCRERVRNQLKLHPRFLECFLEDGGTIDQWIAKN